MKQQIVIDPVTRVEGHSEIQIILDDQERVNDVRFSVKSFRGFERFLEGTPIESLPQLTARICGICYTAHILASCKALENALGITVSPEARQLRELLYLGNFIESHVLSIAALSLPDFVPGLKPQERNVAFLLNSHGELVRRSMKLRQLGSAITRLVGKRPVHPITPVIGGVLQPLQPEDRKELVKLLEGAYETIGELWTIVTKAIRSDPALRQTGDIRSAYLALKGKAGVEFYDAETLAVVSEEGQTLEAFPAAQYVDRVIEEERDFSYMKFPRLKSGVRFRVGPVARVNVCGRFTTPYAQTMLERLSAEYPLPWHGSMFYHLARLVELMYAVERAKELLQDDELLSDRVKPGVYANRTGQGVGIVEAPRGTLVHIYDVDDKGYATRLRFYVATQHNNFAINDALTETARRLVTGPAPEEAALNRLEMIVRAYDPCLSCATHMLGQPTMDVSVHRLDGALIRRCT